MLLPWKICIYTHPAKNESDDDDDSGGGETAHCNCVADKYYILLYNNIYIYIL